MMADAPTLVGKLLPRSMWPPPPPPPPPVPSQRSNLSMLYYSLVVVGTAALLLALYNLIIVKWCAHRHQDRSAQRQDQLVEVTPGYSSRGPNQEFLASFKYKKGSTDAQDKESDYECPVCLSAFEEGEEVKVLPKCKHSFHAPCIDMWLYSHFDCPLCRAHVGPPTVCRHYSVVGTPSENSREGLLGLPT